jgi:hypothetical protein
MVKKAEKIIFFNYNLQVFDYKFFQNLINFAER